MSQSLKNTTFKNISYNAIGKVVAFGFQSVANIILSRELIAADYGVAGFAMIFVAFMKNFSGFGINSAAVHAKEFDEKAMATAFTLRQIIGVVAFGITIAFSGMAEHFIDHKAITSVIRVLAFAILIDNFSLVSSIYLARDLKFSVISLAETGLTAVSSITAIVLALNGFKYWSIVYAFLAANLVYVVITYWYMPYRFKFSIDTEIAKQYLRYGSTVFLTGLLSFTIFNMDNFIIGSVAGVSQLGYYAIAFNWGAMVCSIMGAVVFGVLFPTFSRMRDDAVRMKQAYLKIIQYTALFSVLCNVGLFCVADNFLVTVLGKGTDKWLPSLITLRILCMYGIVRSLIEPASSFLMAQGKTKTPLKAALCVASIELAIVYPAIRYGSIVFVGCAVLFAYSCQLVIYLPALNQTNNIRPREILTLVWPAAVSGIVIIICYFSFNGLFYNGLLKLVGSVVLLSSAYLAVYGYFTRWQVYIHIRDLVSASR
jgi:O-antigen/teichoic acid export membrane protein